MKKNLLIGIGVIMGLVVGLAKRSYDLKFLRASARCLNEKVAVNFRK